MLSPEGSIERSDVHMVQQPGATARPRGSYGQDDRMRIICIEFEFRIRPVNRFESFKGPTHMTANEKVLQNIESLKASLQQDWATLSKSFTAAQRRDLRRQINGCWAEMKKVRDMLKGPGAAREDESEPD
jgi:hypothetical protein